MTRAIACLNAGSSSIKFALFILTADGPHRAAAGKLDGIGSAPRLVARDLHGAVLVDRVWTNGAQLTHEVLLLDVFEWAGAHLEGREIVGLGHRVVHGGGQFTAPVRLDDQVLAILETFCPLAPLHQPHNLAAIRAIQKLAPDLPQVACFDTAFHHDMPEIATRLALPRALHDNGIRRYGFHGLSYEYIAGMLDQVDPGLARGRVIAAHLGNGASLCAMRGGKSVDTTMGFTALDGLMMGTRCGSIDPGVVLHLLTHKGMSPGEIERLLYSESGLLGVSGLSGDMRVLHQSQAPQAAEAIALFTWRAARETGGLIASLGGLDGLVFTAGIGENDPLIRSMICDRLAWTGLMLDPDANRRNAPLISTPASPVAVRVIPTDEESMIARHTVRTLGLGPRLSESTK